ncbi:DNA repair protein rad52 [Trapelia coarctata]|nr:DNA repair protein rad52 [Trapelia coarctata]
MPAPGEQHKPCAAAANPFEEVKPHMNEYTAQEVATLQSRLDKQLGPEYISSRPGAGGKKVHYLAAEKCINLANEVFGFNGWSSAIRDVTVDFIDESPAGKISLGMSVIVRVTLRDGTHHEDIGYGQMTNAPDKASAFEKAKKEGTTDALKRALRNFGNILGNCIYDKEYLGKVTKLKVPPSKWDSENLHRHTEFAPVKNEPVLQVAGTTSSRNDSSSTLRETDDEFGEADFDEADFNVATGEHPDEVVLDASVTSGHFSRRSSPPRHGQVPGPQRPNGQNIQQPKPPVTRMQSMPAPGINGPQTPKAMPNGPQQARYAPGGPPNHNQMQRPLQVPQYNGSNNRPQGIINRPPPAAIPTAANQNLPPQGHNGQIPPRITPQGDDLPHKTSSSTEQEPPVGFFTARVAEALQNTTAVPPNVPLFNPHAESPSIRKTPGVDHTKTKPLGKDLAVVPPALNNALPPMRANFVNPQTDQTRRIGAPPNAASPLQNRGSYKPPQMVKRQAEGNPMQAHRSALNDVTSASVNTPMDNGGGDIKRQKLANGHGVSTNGQVVTG